MFDVPLPVPGNTMYQEIGVDPDASDAEVRWAVGEYRTQLTAEQGALDQDVRQTIVSVEGFREALAALDALRDDATPEGASRLADAQATVARLEEAAVAHDPEFRRKRERSLVLVEKINTLNKVGLDGPEGRAAYDKAHPPLALLRLASDPTGELPDVGKALVLLRMELSSYLAQHGEDVFHPSDLTRDDFSADFAFQPLLDGERHES